MTPHHQIAIFHHKGAFVSSILLKIKFLETFVFIMFSKNHFLNQFWAIFGHFRHWHGYSTGSTKTPKIVPKMAQNMIFRKHDENKSCWKFYFERNRSKIGPFVMKNGDFVKGSNWPPPPLYVQLLSTPLYRIGLNEI